MRVHPSIAALRSGDVSQRTSLLSLIDVAADWRRSGTVRAVDEMLARYATGAALDDCEALTGLLSDSELANDFVGKWIDHFLAGLREKPLGEVPFNYRVSPGVSRLELLQSGRASISVVAYSQIIDEAAFASQADQSVVFVDGEYHELLLAGSATGTWHTLRSEQEGFGQIDSREWRGTQGDRFSMSGDKEARQISHVEGAMVILQLRRSPAKPKPTCKYSIADGRLLHRASGDKLSSRRFMALAVLGALGNDMAIEAMERIAADGQEYADVRWEAVRQALGLDTRRGLALLQALSNSSDDPLKRPARELQHHLLAANPAFAEFQTENS